MRLRSPAADTRFAVFTFGWALVVLFGMSSEQMATTPLQILVCVACGIALLLPRQPLALAAVALAYAWHFAIDEYRVLFVHTGFVLAGCVGVLLALIGTVHRDPGVWRQRFVDAYAPVAVAQAALCFFAAGFAKINTDYLDVEISCGSLFYAHQITVFPYSLLPDSTLGEAFALYLALVIELVAPFLWLHHRTRKSGLWIGGLLLFLLGTNPRARYYVFTGPFLALLLLGLEWEPARRWIAHRVPPRVLTAARIAWWVAVPVGLTAALLQGDGAPETRWFVARVVFVTWAIAVFAAAALASSVRLAGRPGVPVFARAAWVVIALYAAHEALPYLGLKAQRNFTMAGNLAINSEWSNHLLVTRVPALPFNRPAVLETSNTRKLHHKGKTIWPTWVLDDYLARHPNASATVLIDGERVELAAGDRAHARSRLASVLHVAQSPLKPKPRRCGHARPVKE